MGGAGSGFPIWKKRKVTVEDTIILDISKLDRRRNRGHWSGEIVWTETYTGSRIAATEVMVDIRDEGKALMRLSYRPIGTADTIDQYVPLTTTRPFFGGKRWWFRCPFPTDHGPCHRRARKLYMPEHDRRFGCRHCHDLTYDSCQDSHRWDRLFADIAREVYGEDSEDHVARITRGLMGRMRS